MTIKEIYEAADKIGLLTFSTIYNGEVHSRIAHLNGYDQEGIYFRTMGNKPYGRQLRETGKVTICGNFAGGISNHDEVGAAPIFTPGYTLRLIGDVRFVDADRIIEKAKHNPMLEVAARDIKSYPAMANGNFVLYRAKGEIFRYDFEKIELSHKIERKRFSLGGATYNEAGVVINPDICISCGKCRGICSFGAIEVVDGHYRVNPRYCDDCGSCMLSCPVEAITPSLVF